MDLENLYNDMLSGYSKRRKLVNEDIEKPVNAPIKAVTTPEEVRKTEQSGDALVASINAIDDQIDKTEGKESKPLGLQDLGFGDARPLKRHEGTGLMEWSGQQYTEQMEVTWDTRSKGGALVVYGRAGGGKTEKVFQFAQKLAKTYKRELLVWQGAIPEKKDDAIQNPGKYFLLIKLDTKAFDPQLEKGIPKMGAPVEKGKIEYVHRMMSPEVAAMSMRQEGSDQPMGILFLDEFNTAHETVLTALLPLTDSGKEFFERPLSKDIMVVMAGNIGVAYEGRSKADAALMNRPTVGVLVLDIKEWVAWANEEADRSYEIPGTSKTVTRRGPRVNSHIVDFALSQPAENFQKDPTGDNEPFPSPRSLVNASIKMESIQIKAEYLRNKGTPEPGNVTGRKILTAIAGTVGESWALRFQDYVKHYSMYNMSEMENTISSLQELKRERVLAWVVWLRNNILQDVFEELKSVEVSGDDPAFATAVAAVSDNTKKLIAGLAQTSNNVDAEMQQVLWNAMLSGLSFDVKIKFIATLKSLDYPGKPELTKALPGIVKMAKQRQEFD